MKEQFSIGKILSCIHRHSRMYLHHELADTDLGGGSLHFLLILSRKNGLTQQDLTHMLHMDKANTARTVKKLIKNGYVQKQKDPEDHRAVRIFLTDKGEKLLPRIQKVLTHWSEILFRGLNPDEKQEASRLIKKMADNAVAHVRGEAD